ncbi:hypothetical protein HNQ93_003762 [Hymenobacter luteus]|uniref:Uncharacterized protein n=2 Tax=Hymenobacter TaxID=89966 RepID=A0A7W9T3G4_9BACT|nr:MULTISPECIES: hypothetical protein [Hymenobacter]MBB6060887.1 hypothetical protein [Hymenobacter luteus]
MRTASSYHISIGSPVDYEELVAYVVIRGQHVALLNQDRGADDIRVEFLEESKIGSGVEFDTLIEALQAAKKILLNK